ncbi:helix-turn-helix domain-containing protein [Qipengyuania sphaerica]|uniref:helix-turn-helix domain-containing protein n=1 Tax=Qipengyuania sphaerica TaxID=2867243 RepID=UPI001C86DB12|nr:AraC family transcriptional regulator [Qipengyuania sphaerica]MBX7541399.1 AraC family transcriptional regulator [Qipengyuania sphaerica]
MKSSGFALPNVRLKFFIPPPDLTPYISTFYFTEVPEGKTVEDWMHPEWANLRVGKSAVYEAGSGDDTPRPIDRIILSGATSKAMRFRIGGGRFWGVGLLPRGFAKFVGVSARDWADRFDTIEGEPGFAHLVELLAPLAETKGDLEGDVAYLTEGFRAFLSRPVRNEEAIADVHAALVEHKDHSTASLAEAAGMSVRTLERFCDKVFGFTPSLLLQRQRFLRSLAVFMTDPEASWNESLDDQYYDQAHFIREFRRFMTMTPSQYAALDHPILAAAVHARTEAAGDAMQVLQNPKARES